MYNVTDMGKYFQVISREMTKAKMTEANIKMGHAGECEECFPYLHIYFIKI